MNAKAESLLLKTMIRKGNTITFNYNAQSKILKDLKVTAEGEQEAPKDGMWQDEMIRFEDLLNAAHEKKIPFSIKTEMLSIDWEKKYALFKATVEVLHEDNESDYITVFTGHGDATSDNIQGEFIKPHFIRMAETRAIARALRWFTNNAKVSDAELPEGEEEQAKP